MEWGEGTNTLNQVWSELAEGKFVKRTMIDGVTTLTIQAKSSVSRKNSKNDTVKLAQLGEGMSANSERWGEVAVGQVKSVSGDQLVIELPYATKISGAAGPIARFFGLP